MGLVTDALQKAHDALRKAVPGKRKQAHVAEGKLASAFREAMQVVDAQREAGVPQAERLKGLDAVLRDAWPQTREWHYLCETCRDTGWDFRVCTPEARCGRPFRLPGARADDYTGRGRCPDEHSYVVPCSCPPGQEKRRALLKTEKPTAEDFRESAKRPQPTKLGRW